MPGNVVTHQQLLKEVWGRPHVEDTHYLRIFVRKLRHKIETDPNRPRNLLLERRQFGEIVSMLVARRARETGKIHLRFGIGCPPLAS